VLGRVVDRQHDVLAQPHVEKPACSAAAQRATSSAPPMSYTDSPTSMGHPDLDMNGDDTDTPPSTVSTQPVVKLDESDAR
jgi:hypothetical protein